MLKKMNLTFNPVEVWDKLGAKVFFLSEECDYILANNPQATTGNKEIEKLEEDIRTLAAISTTMESLSVPHQVNY